MNPALKERWLNALRSGTYRKGKIYLRFADQYCVGGVFALVARSEIEALGWYIAERDHDRNKKQTIMLLRERNDRYPDYTLECTLPEDVLIAFDIDAKKFENVVAINDSHHTFAECIEYISEEL